MGQIADIWRYAEAIRQENQQQVDAEHPSVIVKATEEQKQKAVERRQELLQAQQNQNIMSTDFILPVCGLLVLIALFLKLRNKFKKGENNMNDNHYFCKKTENVPYPTKWLQYFVKIHPIITIFSAFSCAAGVLSSITSSNYINLLINLFDVGTVILAILVMVHIKSPSPKAYKITMSFFGYLLTLSSIMLAIYLFVFFINSEDILFAIRYPEYISELLYEIIPGFIFAFGYIIYCTLNLCYFYKRKTLFGIEHKVQLKKLKKERNSKQFNKKILIYLWLVYIIAQFCFFVPFKTFSRSYDVHYNTIYHYTGRIIKPLWYDKAYTQIDFPLLLTQAGVVTVVMGILYLTLSQKEEKNTP